MSASTKPPPYTRGSALAALAPRYQVTDRSCPAPVVSTTSAARAPPATRISSRWPRSTSAGARTAWPECRQQLATLTADETIAIAGRGQHFDLASHGSADRGCGDVNRRPLPSLPCAVRSS